MAFYRVPMECLLAILSDLMMLSVSFYAIHNGCTAYSRRSQCADRIKDLHV